MVRIYPFDGALALPARQPAATLAAGVPGSLVGEHVADP